MANTDYSIGRETDDKMVAITKHNVVHYVHVIPLEDTEGFIPGLDTKNLRDKSRK